MALADSIMNRVRDTFSKIVPSAPVQMHQGDALLRSNIPPLMGRRDAAYDRACELLEKDIFAMSENDRISLYGTVDELLRGAKRDTNTILTMLSSPDTRSREHQMLDLMHTIQISVGAVAQLFTGARLLFEADNEVAHFAGLPNNKSLLHDEELISDCEISIIHRVRAFLDSSNARIARYREYTGKSFSQSYAERYRKSHELHHGLFVRNTRDWE